VLNVL